MIKVAIGSGDITSGMLGVAAVNKVNLASGVGGGGVGPVGPMGPQGNPGSPGSQGPPGPAGGTFPVLVDESIPAMSPVAVSPLGNFWQAMASVSGRMPAMGFAQQAALSGTQTTLYSHAMVPFTHSASFSGLVSSQAFVGRSGGVVAGNPSQIFALGDVVQPIGSVLASGLFISIAASIPTVLGQIQSGNIAPSVIGPPHIASGYHLATN